MSFTSIDISPWERSEPLKLNSRLTGSLATIACIFFALFFFAGDVKGNAGVSALPIDLTVLLWSAVLLLSAISFFARGGKVSRQVLWMYGLFLALSMAVTWTDWTPYAVDKTVRLFCLALAAAVLPGFIIKSKRDVYTFITVLIVSGILISGAGFVEVLQGVSGGEPISGINSNTISLGRNAGIALVGLYAFVVYGERRRMWLGVFFLPLTLVLIGSGSRGPALFAVGVIALVTMRWSLKNLQTTLTACVFLGLTVTVLFFNSSALPQGSLKRIEGFVQQQFDNSAAERVIAGEAAIQGIIDNPQGLGIGGFAKIYNFGTVTDRVYPHNVVLELALEHGWLPGLLFLFLIFLSVKRAYSSANQEPRLRPFFAILIFALCNALVSGDLNDNKIIYALLCIGLISPQLLISEWDAATDEDPDFSDWLLDPMNSIAG